MSPGIPAEPLFRRRVARLAIVLIVVLGTLLRFAGLSHDLDQGHVYHPDTPKQIRAVERFLKGNYFYHIGHPDYDGYPYFNSHLTEYVCRVGVPAVQAVRQLLGVREKVGWPEPMTLFWITRTINATLASLLMVLVFRTGCRYWGRATGLLAALFLAVSPADVSACHFASGDSTAAFCAMLAMIFALRIHEEGRLRDYIAGTFFACCAFASKYHAGLVGLSVVLAHVLRCGGPRGVFSRAGLRGWLAMALTAVAGLFIAIPSMFIHPGIVLQDIYIFFALVSSSFRLPEAVQTAGLWGKVVFSVQRNTPILIDILSVPVVFAAILAAIYAIRRDRRLLVLLSLPVLYLVIGVSLRPLSHPIYHTLMTPMVFLAAAVALTRPWALSLRPSYRLASGLLALFTAAFLLNRALGETFFWWHKDTRLMAKAWARENVPSWFALQRHPYTFSLPETVGTNAPPGASLWVSSSIRPAGPPPGYFRLARFRLEEGALPLFRNPVLDLQMKSGNIIRDDFLLPVFQRLPSQTGNELIFADVPEFYRSGKVVHLESKDTVERILVSEDPIGGALVVVQAGGQSALVTFNIAGNERTLALGAGERQIITLDYLDRGYPPFVMGRYFYRMTMTAYHGRARVMFATTPRDRGLLLYAAGEYEQAYGWLRDAARANLHPTTAALALIAARLGGVKPDERTLGVLTRIVRDFKELRGPGDIMEGYGISLDYLNALPYWSRRAEDMYVRGFRVAKAMAGRDIRAVAPASTPPSLEEGPVLRSPPLMLEPGAYTARLRVLRTPADEDGALRAAAEDTGGPALTVEELGLGGLPAGRFADLRFHFEVPDFAPEVRLAFTSTNAPGLVIDRLSVQPDPLGTLRGLGKVLNIAMGGAADGALPLMAYRPLLEVARQYAREEKWSRAFRLYSAAADLRPEDAAPIEGLETIYRYMTDDQRTAMGPRFTQVRSAAPARAPHLARALFQQGMEMRGYRVSATAVARGGELGLNLYWLLRDADADPRKYAIWVHFVDAGGQVVFQGDHNLTLALRKRWHTPAAVPSFFTIPIPPDVPAGTYAIRLGVYSPQNGERLRVVDTNMKHGKRSVTLPVEIVVH